MSILLKCRVDERDTYVLWQAANRAETWQQGWKMERAREYEFGRSDDDKPNETVCEIGNNE